MSKPTFKSQYENFIGGEWVAPVGGEYFANISPVDESVMTNMPRSTQADVDLAVKAAWQGLNRLNTAL